jgi:chromosome segregation ATPase
MIKLKENEITKNIFVQKHNHVQPNRNYSQPDITNMKNSTETIEQNFQNIPYYTLQNNIIYKKPSLNNNSDIQNTNEYFHNDNNNSNKNILNEIRTNIKKNETKIEKMNKTMEEIITKQKDEKNVSKETKGYYSQINEIERIQQENLTLKADSIIYREDIIHLSEINRKLKLELDLAQNKIFELISKNEDINQTLNNKKYEIALLTEAISNIKLTNSGEVIKNLRNNKTKEQKIYELDFELNVLNNEKIKLETEIKNLEERFNLLDEEKNRNEKEESFYKNRINENIYGLEDKIKKLGKQMDDLSEINKELKLRNKKYENNILFLQNEKNNYFDKYNNKKEQFNQLENEYKILENKFGQLLYDIQKGNFIEENEKNQENNSDKKPKKRKSSKQLIVNDLYNKLQEIKENIKNERKFNK